MNYFAKALCVAVVLCVSSVYAATPQLINYQGRLTNAGGTAVPNATYSVTFTIYDAPSGGAGKWTETQSVTTSDGLFAVLLGTVTPVKDTVFNGTTRYLGVRVGADPELTPRTRLVTVPYANRVSTIDGTTGGSVTGNLNLDNSTATTGNILKGGVPFVQNFGSGNTAIGLNAGNLTMSGTENTMTGVNAQHLNTSGNWNTSTGFNALSSNITGNGNTASGHNALLNNTTGKYNAAFGKDALYSNTVGDSNTACGFQTLFSNTNGLNNSAVGFQALLYNNGGSNTAVGFQALLNNTVGSGNTGIGNHALHSNVNGGRNSALGDGSLQNNTSSSNTACGASALIANVGGTGNTGYGALALYGNISGSYNTAIGFAANVASDGLTNATVIGYGASVNASNKVRIGNTSVTKIEGQVAYTFTSDRNQKENFRAVDGEEVLRKISNFGITSWNYKNNDPTTFRHYGPMAQEFFAAFGHDSMGQVGDSVTINSGDEAGILMIAVQALEKRTAELAKVSEENVELKARLEKMEARLDQMAGTIGRTNDDQLAKK